MNNKKSYLVIGFLTFILGMFVTIGSVYIFKGYFISEGESTSNGICYTSCENKVTVTDTGISDAVDKLYDAVVLVENYKSEKLYATGTGFIYKKDEKNGYILTNYHVINSNTNLKIILSDDTKVDASYVGGDKYLDIAVLKIDASYVKKVAELGSSDDTKLGDTVFTIGTPIDYEYRGTVTRGILSGKDRLITVTTATDNYVAKVLQTDAAINPGNSGGPLANSNGQVIGINSLKLVEDEIEGMGFAITIEDVMAHIKTFEAGKDIVRPFLGISMVELGATSLLHQNNISIDSDIKNGVVVVSVVEESSVDGYLQKGDVITKIGDVDVKSGAHLKYQLYRHEVGDKLSITIIRDGKEKEVDVILKEEDATNNKVNDKD